MAWGKETFLRPSSRPTEVPTHSAWDGAGFQESCLPFSPLLTGGDHRPST